MGCASDQFPVYVDLASNLASSLGSHEDRSCYPWPVCGELWERGSILREEAAYSANRCSPQQVRSASVFCEGFLLQ